MNNIKFSDLLKSKTFWGSAIALLAEGVKVVAPQSATALLVVQLLSGLLGIVGFVDRTAPVPPVQ